MKVRTSITHPLDRRGQRADAGRPDRYDAVPRSTRQPFGRRALGARYEPRLTEKSRVEPCDRRQPGEKYEFARLGVPHFDDIMRAFSHETNIAWLQLPIRDGGVPDARFEEEWLEAGLTLRTALRAGKKVLIHCRAGLGRTGMIVARLLVEFGVPSPEAIAPVRRARDGLSKPARKCGTYKGSNRPAIRHSAHPPCPLLRECRLSKTPHAMPAREHVLHRDALIRRPNIPDDKRYTVA